MTRGFGPGCLPAGSRAVSLALCPFIPDANLATNPLVRKHYFQGLFTACGISLFGKSSLVVERVCPDGRDGALRRPRRVQRRIATLLPALDMLTRSARVAGGDIAARCPYPWA